MKKIYQIIGLFCLICGMSACSDMLESDSTRQAFEPELNQKTDSLFYAFGILEAMQELADQYVFQNEMRGDLVKTTNYTDSTLQQLADFSATLANSYDSAYVYYRVINNCNYYIAHRDTNLFTGATNVVINEYVGVKAIRAWAYLQLVRNYKRVKFITEPLTKISQINDGHYPMLDLNGVVNELAPDLEQYTGYPTPNFGNVSIEAGALNAGGSKTVASRALFIPVDVVLGDLYLENGNWDQAISHYVTYLTQVASTRNTPYQVEPSLDNNRRGRVGGASMLNLYPSDWDFMTNGRFVNSVSWEALFNGGTTDIITYIPMAVNRLRGTVTNVPTAFGYDYYATSASRRWLDEIQIVPSDSYFALSDSTDYYYFATKNGVSGERDTVASTKLGDMRASACISKSVENDDSVTIRINKYNNSGNIILYRTTTVLMHLAEAFNRRGNYDIAFAILKDGISEDLLYSAAYLSDESKLALTTTFPLLAASNSAKFPTNEAFGIHTHGAGATRDFNAGISTSQVGRYIPGLSPYQPDTIIGLKMKELAAAGVVVGTTLRDSVNAMEDILCDEYALEFAFEGTRYFDLLRMARHKNEEGLYNGGLWLARKLAYKQPKKDLTIEDNWYLESPFK